MAYQMAYQTDFATLEVKSTAQAFQHKKALYLGFDLIVLMALKPLFTRHTVFMAFKLHLMTKNTYLYTQNGV